MRVYNNKKAKFLIYFLVLGMILSQTSIFLNYAEAAGVELLITGAGVKEEVNITEADWSKYELVERVYSGNNSLGFHKITKVKGYDLFELIGKDNLKTDQDYQVKFTCADGFEFTKSISELKDSYSFSDFTEGTKEAIGPMIAKYSAVLSDHPKNDFNPPITWTDRELTDKDLDKDFPKLVFGQTDIDDMNLSKWGKKVVKITIGDERDEDDKVEDESALNSPYKHISYDGAPYNIDSITGATFTIEGPAVEGYRAISLRQIEEEIDGQELVTYYEKSDGKVAKNTYEGINVRYLLDNFVKLTPSAGNIIFKDKSRKTIVSVPIDEAENYIVAYGINEVPYVYLDTDVGYKPNKWNDNGCFKLIHEQTRSGAEEFSNVAYIYVEEKDAKNIYEHTYAPYDDPKYTDYEIIIHGDEMDKEVRYTVSEIEAMDDIKHQDEYSLSNSEYFWYYNTYKGVILWDLLLKSGIDPDIDENTSVQFIAADNYNFAPLTIKDIKDDSLYGYYEKNAEDLGDGTFDGSKEEPLHTGMPVILAYGYNGYPYVIRPTDEGFNPGLGNSGGPIRVISGKTSYNDTNGSNQVQFLKEIIIGGGEAVSTGNQGGTGTGEITQKPIDKDASWNHDRGDYKEYLDMPVLRVTGSQVKEPMTFTLRQIESLLPYAIKDTYTGDGIRDFEGIILWDLISKVVGLKEDVDVPSIRVFSGQNYNQILRSNEQVVNGVLNSNGQIKQIILAYGVDGYPLVANESDKGYAHNNAYGPLRLIIEENKSMWIKWTDCIVVGSGDYEEPKLEDVKELDLPELSDPEDTDIDEDTNIDEGTDIEVEDKAWLIYKNSTGKELPEASVRSMAYDSNGTLWVGTNSGGLASRTAKGKWTTIKEIETKNMGTVKVDTSYAIAERENGELWVTLGGPATPQGILVMKDGQWSLLNTDNSSLPANFVQELELDGQGGLWIGTQNGLVYVDKNDEWTVYTEADGILPYSIDAMEPDGKGGVWFGFYPDTIGEGEDAVYIGAYQHLAKDGTVTTYDGFDKDNFNINWVRSISMDSDGGVWVVRSGNAPGFGHGEVDYIKDGNRTVYKAKDIYPAITEDDDLRLIEADKESKNTIYIGTTQSGVLKSEGLGKIVSKSNSTNQFPTRQWDSIYFMGLREGRLLIGTNGGGAVYSDIESFEDIKSHWAQDEIEEMTTMGYINGSDGKYRPDDKITRAEFASILIRLLGSDSLEMKDVPFKDIKSTDWFAQDVALAKELGLVDGYTDGTFKPNASIKRQEIGKLLGNLLDTNLDLEDVEDILSVFEDGIVEWAKEQVAATVDAGLIKGFPDNTFGGDLNTTRAEAAVILLRYLKY